MWALYEIIRCVFSDYIGPVAKAKFSWFHKDIQIRLNLYGLVFLLDEECKIRPNY